MVNIKRTVFPNNTILIILLKQRVDNTQRRSDIKRNYNRTENKIA